MTAYAHDWEEKLAWMRARLVLRATWSSEGALTSAEVAPLPHEPSTEEATQRVMSPADLEAERRKQRRRIASLASGGPLRRFADDDG